MQILVYGSKFMGMPGLRQRLASISLIGSLQFANTLIACLSSCWANLVTHSFKTPVLAVLLANNGSLHYLAVSLILLEK